MENFKKIAFEDLPYCSGIYAFYLKNIDCIPIKYQMHFNIENPIYIGRTLSSFRSRDLKIHLGTGMSGQSTFRRSLLAILDFPCVPRSHNSKIFKGTDQAEIALTKWIFENLEIRIIISNNPINLEIKLLEMHNPPMNLKDIKRTKFTVELKRLRKLKVNC